MADFKNNSPEMFSSLSAMFDGEASEQDIELLLKVDQAALSHQLESFHLVQQTLHKDSNVAVGLQDDLVSRIRAKMDAEDAALDREQGTLKNAPLPFQLPEKNKNRRLFGRSCCLVWRSRPVLPLWLYLVAMSCWRQMPSRRTSWRMCIHRSIIWW